MINDFKELKKKLSKLKANNAPKNEPINAIIEPKEEIKKALKKSPIIEPVETPIKETGDAYLLTDDILTDQVLTNIISRVYRDRPRWVIEPNIDKELLDHLRSELRGYKPYYAKDDIFIKGIVNLFEGRRAYLERLKITAEELENPTPPEPEPEDLGAIQMKKDCDNLKEAQSLVDEPYRDPKSLYETFVENHVSPDTVDTRILSPERLEENKQAIVRDIYGDNVDDAFDILQAAKVAQKELDTHYQAIKEEEKNE